MSGEEKEAVAEDHQHCQANSDRETDIASYRWNWPRGQDSENIYRKTFASEKKHWAPIPKYIHNMFLQARLSLDQMMDIASGRFSGLHPLRTGLGR